MRGKSLFLMALLSWLLTVGATRADEIRLKDGTKIIGTIVGFENDSFRVETSYGFALIQKDKVADISITAAKKESEQKPKVNAAVPPPPATAPSVIPAVAKEPATPANSSPGENASTAAAADETSGATQAEATETHTSSSGDKAADSSATTAAGKAGATQAEVATARVDAEQKGAETSTIADHSKEDDGGSRPA